MKIMAKQRNERWRQRENGEIAVKIESWHESENGGSEMKAKIMAIAAKAA
jgi:hypothetical protein